MRAEIEHAGAFRGVAFLLAIGVFVAAAAGAQEAPPANRPGEESAQTPPEELGAIVVTAEKRKTPLMKTATSVTALDGEALKDEGATRLLDLASQVPGLSFSSVAGVSQVFIRGVGNIFYGNGGDPGIAFYNDGIYVSDQRATDVSFFDVERVEVLRGPQGALYGRNATGGAINVISAAPTDVFDAQVGVLLGDYGRRESEGYVSGPLRVADTSMRLSYQIKSLDGYTKNTLAGAPGAPDRLDDASSRAFRLQTTTRLPADGELRLIGTYYDQDDNGPALKALDESIRPSSTPLPPNVSELLFGARPTTADRRVDSEEQNEQRRVAGLVAQYTQPLGNNELTVVGGYRTTRYHTLIDQDSTPAPVSTNEFTTKGRDFSFDARLASPRDDRFSWLVGVNYLRFNQSLILDIPSLVPASFFGLPGDPLAPVLYDLYLGGRLHDTAKAAYADLRYQLTPAIALTAGARWNRETKDVTEFIDQSLAGAPLSSAADSPVGKWTSHPFRVGVEAALSDDTFAYLTYAQGFKSGAINVGALTPPVRPEKVDSVELGVKSSFLDRRGRISADVYYSDYKDMQILQVANPVQVLSNAPATIKGAEVELAFKPTENLTLHANASYLDGKFGTFVTDDLRHQESAVDVKGNPLPHAPKRQAAIGAQYRARLGGYALDLGADYAWRDRTYFSEFKNLDSSQPAYGVLNVHASLLPDDGRWKLYGYVRNVTDRTAWSSMIIGSPLFGAFREVTLIPPRTFGIGLTYSFF